MAASKAADALTLALQEYRTATRQEGPYHELWLREAAEKAWLAVMEATDEFLSRHREKHGIVPVPGEVEAHRDRTRALARMGRDDLIDRYAGFRDELHGDAFYAGRLSEDRLRARLQQACRFVFELTGDKVEEESFFGSGPPRT